MFPPLDGRSVHNSRGLLLHIEILHCPTTRKRREREASPAGARRGSATLLLTSCKIASHARNPATGFVRRYPFLALRALRETTSPSDIEWDGDGKEQVVTMVPFDNAVALPFNALFLQSHSYLEVMEPSPSPLSLLLAP